MPGGMDLRRRDAEIMLKFNQVRVRLQHEIKDKAGEIGLLCKGAKLVGRRARAEQKGLGAVGIGSDEGKGRIGDVASSRWSHGVHILFIGFAEKICPHGAAGKGLLTF